jgi:hypothetical protein
MFIGDNFVQPGLIGNSARLLFLLVLFGVLGGLERSRWLQPRRVSAVRAPHPKGARQLRRFPPRQGMRHATIERANRPEEFASKWLRFAFYRPRVEQRSSALRRAIARLERGSRQ